MKNFPFSDCTYRTEWREKRQSTEKTKVSTFVRKPAALGLNRPVAKFSLVSFPLFYVFSFFIPKVLSRLSRRPFPAKIILVCSSALTRDSPRLQDESFFFLGGGGWVVWKGGRRRHRDACGDRIYINIYNAAWRGSGGSGVCSARRRVLNLSRLCHVPAAFTDRNPTIFFDLETTPAVPVRRRRIVGDYFQSKRV